MKQDMIVILDLGSTENTVVARQIRDLGVYSEIHAHDITLAELNALDNVKGIIADCGFTSPKAIISSVFTGVTHFPAVPTIWFTDLFARVFAHFSLSEMDTRVTLAGNRLPIIMVHGTEDTFVPCEMTKEGFTVCTGPKQLLLVDGAGHGVSYLHDRERYTNLVEAFLKSYIDGI